MVQHLVKLAGIPTETRIRISVERIADPDVESRGLGTRAPTDLSLSSSASSFLAGAQDLPLDKPSRRLLAQTLRVGSISMGGARGSPNRCPLPAR